VATDPAAGEQILERPVKGQHQQRPTGPTGAQIADPQGGLAHVGYCPPDSSPNRRTGRTARTRTMSAAGSQSII